MNKKDKIPLQILATRKCNREAEFLLYGPGFHSKTRVVRNKKTYTRKTKHRHCIEA